MRPVVVVLVAVGLVVGCSGTTASAPTATFVATGVPGPTAIASPASTSTADPTPAPSAVTATEAPPPQAEITIAGSVTPGELGSYVIDDHGSDGPWLPFDTLPGFHVAPTETLIVRFVDGVAISDYLAVMAAAADSSGTAPRGVPARAADTASQSLVVGPLPLGTWVLSVRLFRADGRGDGTTYWAVTVR